VILNAATQERGFILPKAQRIVKNPGFSGVFVEFPRDGCETKKESKLF